MATPPAAVEPALRRAAAGALGAWLESDRRQPLDDGDTVPMQLWSALPGRARQADAGIGGDAPLQLARSAKRPRAALARAPSPRATMTQR